ncbi:MAG: hypothetical protein ACP5RX_02855, partial [Minisyncoccia bacterium]
MEKKSKEIKPTIEGIQLCVMNAERLWRDSKKVSEPTKAALIELSIEETAKAIGLLIIFGKNFVLNNEQYLDEYFGNLVSNRKELK